jgi:hypothetical protein
MVELLPHFQKKNVEKYHHLSANVHTKESNGTSPYMYWSIGSHEKNNAYEVSLHVSSEEYRPKEQKW